MYIQSEVSRKKERQERELHLAYIYGRLKADDEKIYEIPSLTDSELTSRITENGMLVDWE